jgi:hypothetical protein
MVLVLVAGYGGEGPGASGWARRELPVRTSLRLPGRYAMVRWQIWQRVTRRWATVTGKRREPGLHITGVMPAPAG